MSKTGGFALAPQTMPSLYRSAASSRLSNRRSRPLFRPLCFAKQTGDARSDPAIIHPRFAVWYKLGCGNRSAVDEPYLQKLATNLRGGFALAQPSITAAMIVKKQTRGVEIKESPGSLRGHLGFRKELTTCFCGDA